MGDNPIMSTSISIHAVGHHLQKEAISAAPDEKDAYARSAFNRYYYTMFATFFFSVDVTGTGDYRSETVPDRNGEKAMNLETLGDIATTIGVVLASGGVLVAFVVFLMRLSSKVDKLSEDMGVVVQSMNRLIDLMTDLSGRTAKLEGRVDELSAQNNTRRDESK